jgi:catechol 2,3-dioxygenase-like lactoylglutathione lyase family enzyme
MSTQASPPAPIAHIGLLVADLEAAAQRWSTALGYSFSPIARYRTDWYADHSDQTPHFHDARISISREGPPFVELMEFTGHGTHAAANGNGFHHLAFLQVPDLEGRMQELSALGIRDDGRSLAPDGHLRLWFTEPADLTGTRLEFVGTETPPIVRDDGSALPNHPDGSINLWPKEVSASNAPRIHHFGILVADLERARERWTAATGLEFGQITRYRTDRYQDHSDHQAHWHDARISMSTNDGPRIELMEFTGKGTHAATNGEGFHHAAFLDWPSIEEHMSALADQGIRDDGRVTDPSGRLLLWFTAPKDLDGVRLELVDFGPDVSHPIVTDDGRPVAFDADGRIVVGGSAALGDGVGK